MQIVRYDSSFQSALKEFCSECSRLGYANNSSLQSMKVDVLLSGRGAFWILLKSGKVWGASGCHRFDEFEDGAWRLLFRSALLPKTPLTRPGLGKGLILWTDMLPIQARYALQHGAKKLLITSNAPCNEQDPSGRMFQVDRQFRYLARKGYLEVERENCLIYGALQSVWRVPQSSLLAENPREATSDSI